MTEMTRQSGKYVGGFHRRKKDGQDLINFWATKGFKEWLDAQVKRWRMRNRSEAIRNALTCFFHGLEAEEEGVKNDARMYAEVEQVKAEISRELAGMRTFLQATACGNPSEREILDEKENAEVLSPTSKIG